MTKKAYQKWQQDPKNLTTGKVQLWSASGTMLTAQMKLEDARELVRTGGAFVVSNQAIGQIERRTHANHTT